MRSRITLLTLWGIALLQILTVSPSERFRLLEPFSAEALTLLALFAATSIGLLPVPGRRPLVASHLGVVGILVLAHPLTSTMGRDGSLIALLTYSLAVLWLRTEVHINLKLVVFSFVVGLLLVETALSLLRDPRPQAGVVDYGDVMRPYREDGFLLPGLNVRMVGEAGAVELVTERHGFRNREDVPERKPEGNYRILFAGDSFVAGYRVGQEQMSGRQLERSLRARTGRRVDVLVAGLGHPGAALDFVERHALTFEPDLIVIGVTLGNDISQSWLARYSHAADILASLMLPDDAFRSSRMALLLVRLDRTLSAWRAYRRLQRRRTQPITSWYPVVPGEVRLFDPCHSLGHFYVRRSLALVEASFVDLLHLLERIATVCRAHQTEVVFAFFPQRFQVREADWDATVFAYGLDRAAFDLQVPNRRLAQGCAERDLACFDLLPAFRAQSQEDLYLPRGDMHWNARGHAVAGEALAQELHAHVADAVGSLR